MRRRIVFLLLIVLSAHARAQSGAPLRWVVVAPENSVPGITSISWPTKDTVWASTSSGLARSVDGGWHWDMVPGTPSGVVAFRTGRRGCVAKSDTAWVTEDAGITWAGSPIHLSGDIRLQWIADNVLVAIDYVRDIARSTDSGHSWQVHTINTSSILICFSFCDSGTGYYFGTSATWPVAPYNEGAYCLVSMDDGATENRIFADIPDAVADCITLSTDTVIASCYDTVYRTEDGGLSWIRSLSPLNNCDSDLRSMDIAESRGVAIADDRRTSRNTCIIESTDRGKTWFFGKNPIPGGSYEKVVLISDTDGVILAKDGTLLHTNGLDAAVQPRIEPHALSVDVRPNPATASINLRCSLPLPTTVSITFSDALGRVVGVVAPRHEDAGDGQATFDASHLAAGTYYYRLRTDEGSFGGALVVVK